MTKPKRKPAGRRAVRVQKGILRIDDEARGLHGYRASVAWKRDRVDEWFSDHACGGAKPALAEAVAWRDATERERGKPRTERQIAGIVRRSNTGHRGVRRVERRTRRGRRLYRHVAFEVTWSPGPKRTRRQYVFVGRRGEPEAFRQACALQEERAREALRAAPRRWHVRGHVPQGRGR